jgi:hypothetical protein
MPVPHFTQGRLPKVKHRALITYCDRPLIEPDHSQRACSKVVYLTSLTGIWMVTRSSVPTVLVM